MNNDNSTLLILFEPNNEINEERVNDIFNEITLLNKGIKYNCKNDKNLLEVSNKYYNCEINIIFKREDQIPSLTHRQFEGIIYIITGEILNTNKIISIVKNLKNDSVSLFLLAFKDKINVIEDYNNIMPLKEFCADNFIEIISGIFDKDIDQDDGILRLNDAIQSNFWKNTSSKNLKQKEIKDNFNNINLLSNLPIEDKKNEDLKENMKCIENLDITKKKEVNKEDLIFSQDGFNDNSNKNIKDENGEDNVDKSNKKSNDQGELHEDDFLNIIQKMKSLKNENLNQNLNDEDRRKNAEDAIMMLSKYISLEDDDESEND